MAASLKLGSKYFYYDNRLRSCTYRKGAHANVILRASTVNLVPTSSRPKQTLTHTSPTLHDVPTGCPTRVHKVRATELCRSQSRFLGHMHAGELTGSLTLALTGISNHLRSSRRLESAKSPWTAEPLRALSMGPEVGEGWEDMECNWDNE